MARPADVAITRRIRAWLLVFAVGLVLSGVTTSPLVIEVRLLSRMLPAPDALVAWIDRVRFGLEVTGENYPFIAYGTDCLAFAHLVIAIALWGTVARPGPQHLGHRAGHDLLRRHHPARA